MSELYDQIMSQKGSLEKIVMKIPGFKGYQDKQTRRKADTMLRDFIAKQIADCVQKMVRIEKLILDNVGMQYMQKTRNVKGKIQLYHDRVDTAVPGYSGMWAQMKIGAEELEEIYSFDEAQVIYVEKVDAALDALQQTVLNQDGIDLAIMEVDAAVTEALDAFALRDDILTRLSEST
jgi:hypothetical protein